MKRCRSEHTFRHKTLLDIKIRSNTYRENVMLQVLRMWRICYICERNQTTYVLRLTSWPVLAVITAAWRVSGLESRYDAAIEKYKGRAKRIRSRIWNGASSRFGLSKLSETPVEYTGGQKYGMAEDGGRSEDGLYRRGQWGSTQRGGERFVLCRGESRCFWTRTKACARTGATSFRESSAASNSYWGNSTGIIRVVQLRENWESN